MALVTVCVPSYRSAPFLGQTLGSIRDQAFADYVVAVAVEPEGASETIEALQPFVNDRRFGYYVNEQTLGYAANVRGLLRRVETPYFAVLPHDDLWHPRYLETLVARLSARPDALIAFADSYLFGDASCMRTSNLPDDAVRANRLLAFFLTGAEGLPWRGVTRSSVLDREFPVNEYNGFAAEVEWTLQVLNRGPILRHPEPLYLKRQPRLDDAHSVTIGWRFRMPVETMAVALEHHRRQLLDLVPPNLDDAAREPIVLAAEAAMLQRWVMFSNGRLAFSEPHRRRTEAAIGATQALRSTCRDVILARFDVALSGYELAHKNGQAALAHARNAVDRDGSYGEAALQLARVLLTLGQPLEALRHVQRASELAPMACGLSWLSSENARAVSALFPHHAAAGA